MHSFIFICVCCYACLGLGVTYHPIQLDLMLQIHQQPRFSVQIQCSSQMLSALKHEWGILALLAVVN